MHFVSYNNIDFGERKKRETEGELQRKITITVRGGRRAAAEYR
jgi:hypothetical protein